jgi:ABC-type multidrug transport system fused ATPase/permease subunit/CRP-like cAMP-binding protein
MKSADVANLSPDPFGSRGQYAAFFRWFAPYTRGSRARLTVTLVLTVIVLACQAVIPLQVDSILHAEGSTSRALLVLVALAIIQVIMSYFSRIGGIDVANNAAYRLRLDIFRQLLHTKVLRQDGLVRSSVVSRHTTDVDHVAEAFSETIGHGIPGVVRVVQSLILLTFIEWRAGCVMIAAVVIFLLIRSRVGKQLFLIDKERLDASSRVGESVDESITGSRLISGLHMDGWARDRFGGRADRLRVAAHKQVSKMSQIYVGAQIAGLTGLIAVVAFGALLGGDELGTIAVAILYVEGVIRGLEVLPRWIQSLQMAVVSRRRINQILDPQPSLGLDSQIISGPPMSVENLTLPGARLIGLVTTSALDPDSILVALSANSDAESYRVTLEGFNIRRPGVNRHIAHVSGDHVAFNQSVAEHVTSTGPSVDPEALVRLLDSVGLGHLKDSRFGLNTPLGPTGALLNSNERQRLAIACALAAAPDTLLLGPLIPLADADTAIPLLSTLRSHENLTSIVAVRNPDLAKQMDAMIFVSQDDIVVGRHSELLVDNPVYANLWEKRLGAGEVDLSFLDLEGVSEASLAARLVTERFDVGDAIYREGEVADRIVFIMSGHVEIVTEFENGSRRRVAVLGQGNHCGDLRLTAGERRVESAYAMDTCIIRSLSREAISAGMAGLLDSSPTERRIVTSLLRDGSANSTELGERLPDISADDLAQALTALYDQGALRLREDSYSVIMKKTAKKGTAELFDMLSDL